MIREVRDSRADLLFVGMPTPFKEVWTYADLEELGTPVVLPVGGAFDVIAGYVRRAPTWMQAGGLEWLSRLLMEKRYLVTNPRFLALFGNALPRRRVLGPS